LGTLFTYFFLVYSVSHLSSQALSISSSSLSLFRSRMYVSVCGGRMGGWCRKGVKVSLPFCTLGTCYIIQPIVTRPKEEGQALSNLGPVKLKLPVILPSTPRLGLRLGSPRVPRETAPGATSLVGAHFTECRLQGTAIALPARAAGGADGPVILAFACAIPPSPSIQALVPADPDITYSGADNYIAHDATAHFETQVAAQITSQL
jgi:hypothetical protein